MMGAQAANETDSDTPPLQSPAAASPTIFRRNLANIDADEDGTSDMKRIAVFTSGGDAQGMNAALRAVVRSGLERGLEAVSYTHLRAHETVLDLVCRLLLEKKNIMN